MTSGRGIHLSGDLGSRFTNQMLGYEVVGMLRMVLFITIPIQGRVYFLSHFTTMSTMLGNLVQIANTLWDHDDSIECSSEGIPIKVMLQDMIDTPNFQIRSHRGTLFRCSGSLRLLRTAAVEYFRQLPTENTFEMEDVMRLIDDLEDIIEPEHLPLHSLSWVGCFGNENGRWLDLSLLLNGLTNMVDYGILPGTFDALLHSPARKCYLA